MEFGIWFEPEMISEDSDLAREHPEWIMQTGGRLPVRARNQQVLNLTIPEAYDHVHGQMTSILSEYDIAYVKWDHNRDLKIGRAPSELQSLMRISYAVFCLQKTTSLHYT